MTHKHASLFLERKILFFAGGETPSGANEKDALPQNYHPKEEGGKMVFASWNELKAWMGKDAKKGYEPEDAEAVIFGGGLQFELPDGTSINVQKADFSHPPVVIDAAKGLTLSFEQGVLRDGKPVEARVRSEKIYPSRETLDRHVMRTASDARLLAEMKSLRPQIETNMFTYDQSAMWVDGVIVNHPADKVEREVGVHLAVVRTDDLPSCDQEPPLSQAPPKKQAH